MTSVLVAAREDLRRAEAARLLDQLDAAGLAERAARWDAAGLASSNVSALAAATDPEVSDGVKRALVAEIATEFGLGFSTLQEARNVRAIDIVRLMSDGEDVGVELFGLSNGFTDEWMARVKSFFIRRKLR